MIKSITVTNYLGDSIKLDLARPELSGFAVTGVEGLGPGKATINTTEVSTTNGGLFNSSRLPSRNIVISLRYLWNKTIEESRLLSYKYFPILKKVKLLIETDNRKAEIEGYVEANDPKIFSKESGTDISIVCPNPFFYSVEKNITTFYGIEPMFEFPFSNESLTEPLLELGAISSYNEEIINYDGDADVGLTLTLHAIGEVGNITIYNVGTRETMKINVDRIAEYTGSGIKSGDDIVINTVVNNKSVKLIREGTVINILNCIDKESDWLSLSKGENVFAYTVEHGIDNIQFSIENQIVYEGL